VFRDGLIDDSLIVFRAAPRVFQMYFSIVYYKSKSLLFLPPASLFYPSFSQSLDKLLPSATRPERTLSSVHSAGGQIDEEKKSARRRFNFRKRVFNSLPPVKRKDGA
jgi:hypothetical protein